MRLPVTSLFALALVALPACGRISFDGLATDGGSGSDTPSGAFCDRVSDALYCNDFNTADTGPLMLFGPNYVDNAGIDGSPAYVFVAGASSGANIAFPFASHVLTGELHVGARILVEGTRDVPDYLVLLQLSTDLGKVSLDARPNFGFQVVTTVSGGGDAEFSADNTVPRDQWMCVELAVGIDPGPTSFVAGSVNGAEIRGIENIDETASGGFTLGQLAAFTSAATTETFVVHADNMIVSTHPIGCP